MKNQKLIVLCGFARGGTNIVWNLLQSHPDIVAPPNETGYLFKRSPALWLIFKTRRLNIPYSSQLVDRELFRHKMKSMKHADNRFRDEGVLYSEEQMANSALCLKSINDDIDITHLLAKIYPNLHVIGLARNGYSLVDGYLRRGVSAAEAGRLYSRIADKMQKLQTIVPNFRLVKFEDALQQPFEMAEQLHQFVDVAPHPVEKLRLKSKRVVGTDGSHDVKFGDERRKYWFSRQNIADILDPAIERKQRSRLSDEDAKAFTQEAAAGLRYFNYEVLG